MMFTLSHSQIKRNAILCIAYNDMSFIFGIDFALKILEFDTGDESYLSRSYCCSDKSRFYTRIYEGKSLIIPPKEQERDLLIKILEIPAHYRSSDWVVQCEELIGSQVLCKKCKGKGLVDWIEKFVEPKTDHMKFSPEELAITFRSLGSDFQRYEFPNNISVFYRLRKICSDYLRECSLCPVCQGLGFDRFWLDNELPISFISNLTDVIRGHLYKNVITTHNLPGMVAQ